jgi:hypothetical protein
MTFPCTIGILENRIRTIKEELEKLEESLDGSLYEEWRRDYYKSSIEQANLDIIEIEGALKKLTDDKSDGYHTFNELYYHRMILFSVICNQNKDKAWKSMLHSDGSMFDGYFIAGITTPEGNYTYHIEKKYWDKFDVPILSVAPEWDGHVASDVERLYSLLG